jgi:GntR family carbon starvation induced transcriptional regulator
MLMSDPRTFAQAVQTKLSADILSGRLTPGARLRLIQLCETYDVGMSPLREALSELSGQGLVVREGQRGFCVAPVSLEDLRDVTATRVRFEIIALKMAIEAGDTEWEAGILAAYHRLMRQQRTQEHLVDEAWEMHHRAFHLALISACGSPRQLGFCMNLHDHFDRYRRIAVLRSGEHPRLQPRHSDIVDAVLAKDVARACDLLTDHIEESALGLMRLAEPDGFAGDRNCP